ncbi:MAG: hypothetical protein K5883_03405 [Pseudobutyrivibrio sp.]|nr:hypothetical protein [Pseudobutyrivibrio sp.]
MIRGSTRAAALGLSTITLASSLAFPIYAEASDDSESPVFVPETEDVEEITSQETAVTSDVNEIASQESFESITPAVEEAVDSDILDESALQQANEIDNCNNQIEESIDSAVVDIGNIEKAADAMEEASSQADEAVSQAEDVTEDAKESAEQALEDANSALAVVEDETTDIDEVEIAIEDADMTLIEAEEKYEIAEADYNDKLAEYEAAKSDYETAVEAYNSNKASATQNLQDAADALDDAQNRLSDLQQQLEEAKQQLVDAGAAALVSADENKDTDVSTYVVSVIQHYYVPKTQLFDGQKIDNYSVTSSSSDYVSISYDILDSEGNFLRNVSADYGYTIDKESGEVHIYDNHLVYRYTDANNNVVELTKEQASELQDGQIAIKYYWTVTGFYIPRYQDTEINYTGNITADGYTDGKAVQQGKTELENKYDSQTNNYFNSDAAFQYGWKTDYSSYLYLNLFYNVTYDRVDTLNTYTKGERKTYEQLVSEIEADGGIVLSSEDEYDAGQIRYITGYALNEAVSSAQYKSYTAAFNAIRNQAINDNYAIDVDAENSRFDINLHTVYAKLQEAHKNTGKSLFGSNDGEYTSYVGNLANRLSAYNNLLKQISSAQAEYDAAKSKVGDLQKQIADLDAANEINAAARITELEIQLERAKDNLDDAQENLYSAEDAISLAFDKYVERFNPFQIIFNPQPQPEPALEPEEPEIPVPATVIVPEPVIQITPEQILEVIEKVREIEKAQEVEEDSDSDDEVITEIAPLIIQEPILEELPIEEIEEINDSDDGSDSSDSHDYGSSSEADAVVEAPLEEVPPAEPEKPATKKQEEETITMAGILARGKWFVGLAGASTAGAGVVALEVKRRAAIKLLDKLNQ